MQAYGYEPCFCCPYFGGAVSLPSLARLTRDIAANVFARHLYANARLGSKLSALVKRNCQIKLLLSCSYLLTQSNDFGVINFHRTYCLLSCLVSRDYQPHLPALIDRQFIAKVLALFLGT